MKKTHIILIVMIAVTMGIIFSTLTDSTESVNFSQAFEQPEKALKITGTLDKTKDIVFEPEINPSITSFHMKDKRGEVRKIILQEPKPQGLENSQEITLFGSANGDHFLATEMQMKCPSKYDAEKHIIEGVSQK